MLRKETVKNLKNVYFIQDNYNEYTIKIVQEDRNFYSVQYEIGRFNFYTNEGYIVLPKIGKKEYKRFGSLMNAIFKIDEFFGWDASVVENAKKAAQNLKEEEKKQREIELKKYEEGKASKFIVSINNNENNVIDMIKNKLMDKSEEKIKQIALNSFRNVSAETINNVINAILNKINELSDPIETTSNNETEKQETKETTYIVFNRSFESYETSLQYCKENDFSSECIEKVITNRQPSYITVTNNNKQYAV
jgi:23S rRNA maturation mini-RNase III